MSRSGCLDFFVAAIRAGTMEARSSSVATAARQPFPQLDAMIQINDWLPELESGFLGVGGRQSCSYFSTQVADIMGVAVQG